MLTPHRHVQRVQIPQFKRLKKKHPSSKTHQIPKPLSSLNTKAWMLRPKIEALQPKVSDEVQVQADAPDHSASQEIPTRLQKAAAKKAYLMLP